MTRERLPLERSALIHRFAFGDGAERIRIYLHAGMYPDGRLGEIFLTADKQGSLLSALFDTVAVLISVALQNGVPLADITSKLKNTRFEPMIVTDGAPEIPHALSVLDYLGRYLELRFPNGELAQKMTKAP